VCKLIYKYMFVKIDAGIMCACECECVQTYDVAELVLSLYVNGCVCMITDMLSHERKHVFMNNHSPYILHKHNHIDIDKQKQKTKHANMFICMHICSHKFTTRTHHLRSKTNTAPPIHVTQQCQRKTIKELLRYNPTHL